ncbi:MAG: type II toxin-antitoxin system RelE family toxin [Thermoanaerobaculia bacterium]
MAGYELRITDAAAKELDALPRAKDRRAVANRILELAEEPRPPGCVKLSGLEELYRVRQGPYRVVYTIEDDHLVVIVIRVADRKDAYRKGRRTRSLQRTRPFGSSE